MQTNIRQCAKTMNVSKFYVTEKELSNKSEI